MRILTVPNWSFGRDSDLLRRFGEHLDGRGLTVHYLSADVDHNRAVSAISGEAEEVAEALLQLCGEALPRIDLNRHVGVHPRIGALDVCPFVTPWGGDPDEVRGFVEGVADEVASRFDVPVFLYEKSERGRHESDLPALRRGGFGSLLERDLQPDFGPDRAHPRLGATVMGWREFLVALNVDFDDREPAFAKGLAKDVRRMRSEGDPRFLGVRALGFPLPSRRQSQLSLNMTLPDITQVDPIVEWVSERAVSASVRVVGPELVGVIRDVDMEHATRMPVKPEQVVPTR